MLRWPKSWHLTQGVTRVCTCETTRKSECRVSCDQANPNIICARAGDANRELVMWAFNALNAVHRRQPMMMPVYSAISNSILSVQDSITALFDHNKHPIPFGVLLGTNALVCSHSSGFHSIALEWNVQADWNRLPQGITTC